MKTSFFSRHALIVLMMIFFLVPFSMRGARLAMQSMGNDIKEWLPSDFPETKDLDWFRENFLGEQFIVVTWDGCTGKLKSDDAEVDPPQDEPAATDKTDGLRMFVEKLVPEVPPSRRGLDYKRPASSDFDDDVLGLYVRQIGAAENEEVGQSVGDELGLHRAKQFAEYDNWGGKHEKWLRGLDQKWYFITPKGVLYRWHGRNNVASALYRIGERWMTGSNELVGDAIDGIDVRDGTWYYEDPRRLSARLFKTVTTGPGVLHQLTRDGGPLSGDLDEEEEARNRLAGTLFGPDGEQTCVILTLTDVAREDLHRVLGRGLLGKPTGRLFELADELGLDESQLHLGGPPVDTVAIDEESSVTLIRLIGWSALVGMGLSLLCLRSIKMTMMVFFVGGISAVTALSAVWWWGDKVDAIVLSMPPLVYVLGLSGAIHIVNYYRDARADRGLEGAPGRALAHGWWPCFLAAGTTSIGLLSLLVSSIVPIRKFGFFSAVGVMGSLILLFAYLPAALQMWPPRIRYEDAHKGFWERKFDIVLSWFDRGVDWFAAFLVRRNVAVSLCCTAVLILFAFGLPRIETTIHLIKLFDKDAKIIQDYRWMENDLGKLIPMELAVKVEPQWIRTPTNADAAAEPATIEKQRFALNFLDRMEIVNRLQQAIEQEFGPRGRNVVGRAMGAPTFAVELPGPTDRIRGGVSRSLERHRQQFIDSDYLRLEKVDEHLRPIETGELDTAEIWRVSLRLGALNDVDYGLFVNELKTVVEPVMTAYRFRNEQILPTAFAQQGDDAGAPSVVVLGARNGKPQAGDGDTGPVDANEVREHVIDQTRVFCDTLVDVLRAARVTVKPHDPQAKPFPADYARSDEWAKALEEADCVVLVADHSSYDMQFIRQHAEGKLVDARTHLFNASTGSKTARELAADDQTGIYAIYTGVVPVVFKAQRALLESLIRSIGWAFVLICLVMMTLLRSPRAGLVSMLPNVFPVVLIFGAMGWLNIQVDVGSMMTASVAMGVAVDDTIHFLTWFRWELDAGKQRKAAIQAAYKRVSRAMFQTTAIGGLGLFVFAASTFTPTQKFGVLMLTLLVAALIGDLIFLPAILAGPLGRVFTGAKKDRPSQPSDEADQLQSTIAAETPSLDTPAETGRIETPHSAGDGHPGSRVHRHDKAHRQRKR